jgi:hypothetical protein
VWHAANNDWFEYPGGSCLHYFRFPSHYHLQARDGVNVFFVNQGPSTKGWQPRLSGPDEQDVIRSKARKFIKKGYIAPPGPEEVKSLINILQFPRVCWMALSKIG